MNTRSELNAIYNRMTVATVAKAGTHLNPLCQNRVHPILSAVRCADESQHAVLVSVSFVRQLRDARGESPSLEAGGARCGKIQNKQNKSKA